MNKKNPLILFCILGIIFGAFSPVMALNPDVSITQYSVRVWDTNSGLPGNTVYAVQQTSDGYLWIGTPNGLVRFNGHDFKSYTSNDYDGLNSNDIRALLVDRDDYLWVGTESGGLSRFKNGIFKNFPVSKYPGLLQIKTINQDRWGNLWIGTSSSGLTCYRDGNFKNFTAETEPKLPGKKVRFISKDGNGDLWAAGTDGVLKIIKGQRFQVHMHNAVLPPSNRTITACYYDTDSRGLLVGTINGGLFRVKDGKAEPVENYPASYKEHINYLYKDAGGNVWIGTDGGGLKRMTRDSFTTLPMNSDKASGVYVSSICEDKEGSLWVGAVENGLIQLRDSKFISFTKDEGLENEYTECICEDGDNSCWIGTKGGVYRLEDGKARAMYMKENGLLNNHVLAIVKDRSGNLWIGTYGGVNVVKNGILTPMSKNKELPNKRVTSMVQDREGFIWIGTENGLNRIDENESKITTFLKNDGPTSNKIVSIHLRRNGGVLVGTDDGVNYIENEIVSHFCPKSDLTGKKIICIYEDAENVLWFGTGQGLIRLKGNESRLYNTTHGLIENNIYSILEDNGGFLWLAGRNGISRIKKNKLERFSSHGNQRLSPKSFNEIDGMKSRWCTGDGRKTRDGKLWFPTSKGVTMIDPANMKTNKLSPSTSIEKLIVDGKTVDIRKYTATGEELKLERGVKTLEFYYTIVSFINPQRIKFEIRLYDEAKPLWETVSTRSTHSVNLSHGSYRFEVAGYNSDGVKSEKSDSLSFSIKPYLYQETWFKILLVLCIVLVVFYIYRLRVGKFKVNEEKLRQLVEERTKDLKEAKENAVRANQAKSEFLSQMSHDIRTPLNAILGFSDILHNEITDKRQGDYLSSIRSSGRTLLGLIDDILDLSRIEAGKLVLEEMPVDFRGIFKGIKSVFFTKLEEKQLDFLVEVDPDFPAHLMLDEKRIHQVFFNLVGNAVKFTPSGYIKITAESRPHVPLSGKKNRDHFDVQFRVQDTGIGIPPDQLEAIFGAFVQKEGQSHAQYGGSGLGLAITRRLAELMGGSITASSSEGEGTVFIVCLNGVRKASKFDLANSLFGDSSIDIDHIVFKNACILIVDDIQQNRGLILSYLRDYKGLQLLEAENGEDAVELTRKQHPDLILMDMVMPGMDGFQAASIIRNDDALKHVHIIAVTASVMKSDEIKFKKVCDGFLKKPLTRGSLVHVLAQFLDYVEPGDNLPVSPGNNGSGLNEQAPAVEDLEKLTRLASIMEKRLHAKWQQVCETLTINDIEALGKEAGKTAVSYGFPPLEKWGNELVDHMFDIDALEPILMQYPSILEELRKKISSKERENE